MAELTVDINEHARLCFTNRSYLGICVWRLNEDGRFCGGRYFSFEETLCVGGMIAQGWDPLDAATMVWNDLVCAVPFVPGFEGIFPDNRDMAGSVSVAFVRLCDNSVWEILGDANLRRAKPADFGDVHLYRVSATQELEQSGEDIRERVAEVFTVVNWDIVAGLRAEFDQNLVAE